MISAKDSQFNFVCVGIIAAAHGIKGFVKIKYFTANYDDITKFDKVFNEMNRVFNIRVISTKENCVIASIEGINNRNDAEKLQNTTLYIDRNELPQAANNEYYHTDLIDCAVKLEDGLVIGKVQNIHNFGAGDIIEIHDQLSNKNTYYPFDKTFVKQVNIDDKYIIIANFSETITLPE